MLHDGGDDLDDDGDDGPRWEVSWITLLQVGRSWSHLASKFQLLGTILAPSRKLLALSWASWLQVEVQVVFYKIAKKHSKNNDFHMYFNAFCRVGGGPSLFLNLQSYASWGHVGSKLVDLGAIAHPK